MYFRTIRPFILSMLLLVSAPLAAQISAKGMGSVFAVALSRAEGTWMADKAFFSLGAKIPLDAKFNNHLGLRGHFNWWNTKDRKLTVIPELDYIRKLKSVEGEKFWEFLTGLYVGAGLSPNYIAPKAGIVFYRFLSVELGHNFELLPHRHFPLKGFRASVGFNVIL